jgi:hypothetical protein
MRIEGILFVSVMSLVCSAAQVLPVEPPLDLDALVEGIGNPVLTDVPALTKEIESRGISFDLENHLTQIVRAGFNGKRDPDQLAALILASLQSCQGCRARFLAPMTKKELLMLKQWRFSPEVILDEARVRGVKDIEITESAANELRSAGFSEDLVNQLAPDDKIPVAALEGYKTLPLKRAPEYDPSAPEGWLRVTAGLPANSQSEFKFKHNGLFAKVKRGGEAKVVSCSFNKPAPRNTKVEFVDLSKSKWGLEGWDQKNGSRPLPPDGKAKGKPLMEVSYLDAEADGRNAFQIVLSNYDSSPKQYTFDFYWQVLKTPKTSSVSPSINAGAER